MKIFCNHLKDVEETYWEHFRFAIWSSALLLGLSILSLIHGIFPYTLARVPDKVFRYWYDRALPRMKRVNSVLAGKGLEQPLFAEKSVSQPPQQEAGPLTATPLHQSNV